jgi:type II secretory pathway pseudopilin PulG
MRKEAGFTYLGVLLAIALIGIGLAAASEVWVASARRQRVEQLEWVGQQYAQAIGSYYESTPGRSKKYPSALQDLLADNRYVTVRRHLRQLYANPLTGGIDDWELLRSVDGGVRGVRAVSNQKWGVADMASREFSYSPTNAR